MLDPALAEPGSARVIHDYEFAQSDRLRGACYHFIARAGRVTLLHLRCTPQGWQAVAAGGESVGGAPRMEGYAHAAVRLDAPIRDFLHGFAGAGSTQHWIMAYGDWIAEIQAACAMLGIALKTILPEGA